MKTKFLIIATVAIISLSITVLGLLTIINSLGGFSKKFENFDYIVDNDKVIIVGYNEKQGEYSAVIPDVIEGMPVIEVRDFGLFNTNQVQTITIGLNVQKIGDWAFTNNSGLNEFFVVEGNTNFVAVDGVLFSYDKETLLYYPARKGIITIKNEFNLDIETIPTYTVPDGTKVIRKLAFYNCKLLSEVVLAASVNEIQEKAFFHAQGLSNITFNEGLKTIGTDAFSFCFSKGFDNVVIPSSVTYVGDYAFYNATSIKQMKVNKNHQETSSWGEKWWPSANGKAIVDITFNDKILTIAEQKKR